MNRTEVLQGIIDRKKAKRYLEIGVDFGDNFFPIRAARKTAVDPHFKFSKRTRLKWSLKNPCNFLAAYHPVTSDRYFETAGAGETMDVIFVDGLHNYPQSFKDVSNALKILAEDGVIVMHDCHPPNEAAAHPADSLEHAVSLNLPGFTNAWCGDVYRTICHLRNTRSDLSVFVLDCDYGLGVIRKSPAGELLNLPVTDMTQLSYPAFAADKIRLLDLKPESYFPSFLETL